MPELRSILEHCREGGGASGVMATVVHVQGSAYRRPGARMLLLEDGRRIGTISGGCLEGDLARKAWWWTSSGKPTVRVYDTSSDEDAVWEFGLGCNGIVDVLLERLESQAAQQMLAFAGIARARKGGAVSATVIRRGNSSRFEIGDRLFFEPEGECTGPLVAIEADLRPALERTLEKRMSCLVHLDDLDLFVEWIGPVQRLFVFGAGHDAQPVVELAAGLGWEVHVADGRPAYTCRERFPRAEQVHLLPVSADLAGLDIDEDSAVVLMTHNLPQDERLLGQILARRPRYFGLLGPVRRTERLFGHLGLNHRDFDVHAPVGLDLGGDNPATIALAIVAEIQAVLGERAGGPLRLRREKIHDEVEEVGVTRRLRAPSAGLAVCEVGRG